MNPNLTVSYLAIHATQHQLEQRARRGWQATQAAQLREQRAPAGVTAVGSWLIGRAACSPWLVTMARRIVLAAGAARVLPETAG